MKSFLNERKKSKAKAIPKKRDRNIEKSAGNELNLGTKSVPDKTKYTRKAKHKNRYTETIEDTITESIRGKLEMLAGVFGEDYDISETSLSFNFKNSLRANYCNIISYHDKIIIEFRKKSDNLIEGRQDLLVFEDVIDKREFQNVFEMQTGIYLSFI